MLLAPKWDGKAEEQLRTLVWVNTLRHVPMVSARCPYPHLSACADAARGGDGKALEPGALRSLGQGGASCATCTPCTPRDTGGGGLAAGARSGGACDEVGGGRSMRWLGGGLVVVVCWKP